MKVETGHMAHDARHWEEELNRMPHAASRKPKEDGVTKRRRDEETEGRRDKETKRRRDKKTKGRRD